ncbi:MAG: hypothetical protein M9941_02595 [Anaerolineae bacterium]|nr:hypothetical protein [Anaerolineae bacterium]
MPLVTSLEICLTPPTTLSGWANLVQHLHLDDAVRTLSVAVVAGYVSGMRA